MLTPADFARERKFVDLPSGRIAYHAAGSGPAALFVHGLPLNGFHWRNVIAGVSDLRRCFAPDLMGLGYSEVAAEQDLTFPAQAQMLLDFIDALGIEAVDLVGNDSGGGVSQIFAAEHPERLRTLTLTNCDTHDGWPPPAFAPIAAAAAGGRFADVLRRALAGDDIGFGNAYADPSVLTPEVLEVYLKPLVESDLRVAQLHKFINSEDCAQTVAIEPKLRQLNVPTTILWALDDGFFDVKWAHWLKDTIPGAHTLIEVPNAKLFFPEDRPQVLIDALRTAWPTE